MGCVSSGPARDDCIVSPDRWPETKGDVTTTACNTERYHLRYHLTVHRCHESEHFCSGSKREPTRCNESNTMSNADISTLSVRELKKIIAAAGLSHDDCIEKPDLQQRAREAQGRAPSEARLPSVIIPGVSAVSSEARIARTLAIHTAYTRQGFTRPPATLGARRALRHQAHALVPPHRPLAPPDGLVSGSVLWFAAQAAAVRLIGREWSEGWKI